MDNGEGGEVDYQTRKLEEQPEQQQQIRQQQKATEERENNSELIKKGEQ
ncbi:MAG: hypothetical protein WBZ20_15910 [Nitrososphaeraceae archaeon]